MSDYDLERATRDDLEDRLTDHALAEALGGKCPPDLTGAILSAARPSSILYRVRGPLAAAATLLLAVTAVALSRSRDPESQIVRSKPVWPATSSATERLRAMVDDYNRLIDEQRFAEAEVVAKRALREFPRDPIVNQVARQIGAIRRLQQQLAPARDHLAAVDATDVHSTGVIDTGLTDNLAVFPDSWGEIKARGRSTNNIDDFVLGTHSHHDSIRSLVPAQVWGSDYTVAKPVYERDLLVLETFAFHDRRTDVDFDFDIDDDIDAPFQVFGRAEESLEGEDSSADPPFARLSLRERLEAPVSLQATDSPLLAVIGEAGRQQRVSIAIDRAAVLEAGVTADTPVTSKLENIPLKDALRSVLGEHNLAFVVVGDSLLVTSQAKAGVALERRVFPLGDVVLPAFDPEDLPPDHGIGPGQAGDRYERIEENPYLRVAGNPLSTFSIDVDTASYAKVRRYVQQEGMLPPPDAVRIEELVNYFSYDYAPPAGDAPFAAHVEVAACPWQPRHRLARIAIQGREIENEARPASNLVFLVDVSGSMQPDDKLPRVRRALRMLVEQLGENDRVAIVVYASATGLVLPSTSADRRETILTALEGLESGGSTNGGAGIQLAYATAAANFIEGGTNRVILCTDGDFNVGVTSDGELERLIEEQAAGGVFLSVLGFGMGNHNDAMLEKLADRGNGNHGYIDTEQEARKLLVEELAGTLVTIAKDVKLQVEFNPQQVAAYRLIGYENRLLRAEDFDDDTKDAGEIGAGHAVTALYEIIPAGEIPPADLPEAEPLRYQTPAGLSEAAASGELLTLRIRYKDPDAAESHEPLVFPVRDEGRAFGQASADFKFSAAVASFGMLLRGSDYRGETSFDAVAEIAQEGIGADPHGYRAAFLDLVRQAKELAE